MIRYKGGQKADKGAYWDLSEGRRVLLDGPSELPGGQETVYYKVPTLLMVCAVPLMGLGYVLLLPTLVIATAAYMVAYKLIEWPLSLLGYCASFGWRPVEAYLAGRKKNRKKDKGR